MEGSFTGKVVLVTGATSGIGHAVAVRFAGESAGVVAVGRNQSALREVEGSIGKAGGEPLTIAADVTKDTHVHRAIEEAVDKFGRLDVLVNAAGHISTGSIEETSLAAWDAMMNVNLRAVFHLMKMATSHLIKSKGNIVNISSHSILGGAGLAAYSAAKGAVFVGLADAKTSAGAPLRICVSSAFDPAKLYISTTQCSTPSLVNAPIGSVLQAKP